MRSQSTNPGVVEYINIIFISDDASVEIMDSALKSGTAGETGHQCQHDNNCQYFLYSSHYSLLRFISFCIDIKSPIVVQRAIL